jgi:hypothetical protein
MIKFNCELSYENEYRLVYCYLCRVLQAIEIKSCRALPFNGPGTRFLNYSIKIVLSFLLDTLLKP